MGPKKGRKNFQCEYCHLSFAVKISLQSHLERHIGNPNYKCNSCDKSFYTSKALDKHIICIHEKVKTFTCSICEKSFTLEGNLRKHINDVHGIKEQECEICSKFFSSLTTLNVH